MFYQPCVKCCFSEDLLMWFEDFSWMCYLDLGQANVCQVLSNLNSLVVLHVSVLETSQLKKKITKEQQQTYLSTM